MTPLSWLLFALSCIGAFNVGAWSMRQLRDLMFIIEEWADHRAYMICARAIVAYEFGRGKHIGPSIKYAIKIMCGGAR